MTHGVLGILLLSLLIKTSTAVTVEGRIGGSARLVCNSSSSVTWYRQFNQQIVNLQLDSGKYDGVQSIQLVINRLTLNDIGKYICWRHTHSYDSPILLDVFVQGVITYKTEIPCETSRTLYSYGWQIQETEDSWIYLSDTTKYYGINSPTLEIISTQMNNAGLYRCQYCYSHGCFFGSRIKVKVSNRPINGSWGEWSEWGACSTTCDIGVRSKTRKCNNPVPTVGGIACQGTHTDTSSCLLRNCSVNGAWGDWSHWYGCTKTCGGNGNRNRVRECNNPSPSNGGLMCPGVNSGTKQQVEYGFYDCADSICPVNGNWGNWLDWTACSKTCNQGERTRNRLCNNPLPAHGGHHCFGISTERNYCTVIRCPVNGMWSGWNYWSTCSLTCGGGTKSRSRLCDNPKPAYNGQYCNGNGTEQTNCIDSICPVDGSWTVWSEWSVCSVLCGGGNKTRNRTCTDPEPAYSGKQCVGFSMELESCSMSVCQESPPQTSATGPAAGGLTGGIIVMLFIVVAIVILKRKRTKPLERNAKMSAKTDSTNKNRTYLNVGSMSRFSSSDTDDNDAQVFIDLPNKISEETDPDNVYCNMSIEEGPTTTNIKVDELGAYIKRREINDGLRDDYKILPYGLQYPTTTASTKENISKNRFKTTFPYDHSRVVLTNGADYINANFIDGFERENCYIASQGPLKSTLADHWRMIWQQNISRIVMLTNLVEGGKRKCEQYWPDGDKPSTYGNFVLTLHSEKARTAYVTREIAVENKKTKERRTIIQYHFTSWPDHGTPDPLYLVLFHRHVMSGRSSSNTGPLLVHCSAGIGRTGTYIGLDALFEQGKTTGYIDVAAFVKKMRHNRLNMVQTPDQYVCLHGALLEAFTMKDTTIKKNDFGAVWRDIVSDKRPINHQRLKEEFKMLEEKKHEHIKAEHVVATSPENKNKNRNESVLPADDNRIFLSSFEKGRTDYINAVQTPSYTQLVGYVATQMPLPDTKVDFWTMVRDQDSSIIVLFLKDYKEADFLYSSSKLTGSLGLNTLKISNTVDEEDGIKTTNLTLSKKDDRRRDIVMYQVTCDGLPEASVLCKLANLMSTRISMTESPVTVVSSDGANICGLFCTFTNAVSSMTIDENADIFQLARLIQLKRPEFFRDFEEYRKVYEAINYYLDSANIYANY